jgi:thiamine biosynthesis lipoprotein
MSNTRVTIRPWLLLLTALLLIPGCKREDPVFNTRFQAFGTLVDLSIIGMDKDTARSAARALEQDFAFMEQAWHPWKAGPLVRVNERIRSGEWFSVPPSVLPLIKLGRRYAEQSGGLLDPAIGRLVGLWGFHGESPECGPPPPDASIAALVRAHPTMSDLELDGIRMRSTNPEVQLDFGAYDKGYGIDQAIAHLREMGVRNATVSAGGDLRAIGDRDGQPWRITLRRPNGGVFAVIELSGDESVFTAGGYESSCVYEGKTYHHIIDPRTGYPAEGVQAATVLHQDAVTADAAATALVIAGPDGWVPVARNMGVRNVLLLDDTGTFHLSPSMAKRVQFLDSEPDVRLSEPL